MAGTQARPRARGHPAPGPAADVRAQLRQWFQYRIDGPSPVNNIPFAARITGPCDADAFVAAIGDLVARHEVLRTTYREIDGVPYQFVGRHAAAGAAARGADEEWLQPNWMPNVGTVRSGRAMADPGRGAVDSVPGEHVLSIVVHHIAADHWSAGVLFTDLLTAYRARAAGGSTDFAALPVQYADYAAWQGALLADEAKESVAAT